MESLFNTDEIKLLLFANSVEATNSGKSWFYSKTPEPSYESSVPQRLDLFNVTNFVAKT